MPPVGKRMVLLLWGLAIPEAAFPYYLPPAGRVEIGKPIFPTFIDGPPPR